MVELNVPTGIPLVYGLDDRSRPTRHYDLWGPERVDNVTKTCAGQASLKTEEPL